MEMPEKSSANLPAEDQNSRKTAQKKKPQILPQNQKLLKLSVMTLSIPREPQKTK